MDFVIPDAFTYLHSEITKLEQELRHLPMKWKQLWDKLDYLPLDAISVRKMLDLNISFLTLGIPNFNIEF